MAINNWLIAAMKTCRQKFPLIGKCVQDSAVSTFLGVIVGFALKLFPESGFNHTIKEGFENLFMI